MNVAPHGPYPVTQGALDELDRAIGIFGRATTETHIDPSDRYDAIKHVRDYLLGLREGMIAAAQQAVGCGDDEDRMEKISALISRLQAVLDRFGDTCVYIRRGGLSWGAVALNRQDDDKKHGVFDLQAQHDRDMEQRVGQVERLIADKNRWMELTMAAEGRLADAQKIIAEYQASTTAGAKADVAAHGLPGARVHGWQDIETAPHETRVLLGWIYDGAWFCETGMASHGWRRGAYSTMSCHGQATHWQPLPDGPVVSSTVRKSPCIKCGEDTDYQCAICDGAYVCVDCQDHHLGNHPAHSSTLSNTPEGK